jgi:hypothetical protein
LTTLRMVYVVHCGQCKTLVPKDPRALRISVISHSRIVPKLTFSMRSEKAG